MIVRESESDYIPDIIRIGATKVLVRGNYTYYTTNDEDGNVLSRYSYTEYVFTPFEYEKLKLGKLDGEWNETLHNIYRTELHRQTDDLYAMANRKLRTSEDRDAWEAYITELDVWNDKVSGLVDGFRIIDTPLPPEPNV